MHPVDQLGGLFHDGEVGGEPGVEDCGETDPLECRGQMLEHHGDAFVAGPLLVESGGDRRGDLSDDHGVGVAEGGHHIVHGASLHERAGGADPDALAAVGAAGDVDAGGEARPYLGAEAPVGEVDGPDPLDLVAHGDAPSAQHALVGIAGDGRGGDVQMLVLLHPGVLLGPRAHLAGQIGQLATPRPVAHQAVLGMVGDHQFHDGAAGFEHARGVGADDHAFGRRQGATGLQPGRAFDFHHAEAAGRGGGRSPIERAEMGDADAGPLGSLEHGLSRIELDYPVIDGDVHDDLLSDSS